MPLLHLAALVKDIADVYEDTRLKVSANVVLLMGSAPCNRGALNDAPPLPEVSGKHANEVSQEALTNHFRGKFFRLLAMTARTLGSSVPAF